MQDSHTHLHPAVSPHSVTHSQNKHRRLKREKAAYRRWKPARAEQRNRLGILLAHSTIKRNILGLQGNIFLFSNPFLILQFQKISLLPSIYTSYKYIHTNFLIIFSIRKYTSLYYINIFSNISLRYLVT